MSAIWRLQGEEWRPLLPSGFPSEAKLHDLIEGSPNLLPLAGDPSLTILGREVAVGPGYADLIAIESDGRPVIIEIKLRKNAEARRAVVAQILTYAAFMKGISPAEFEDLMGPHLASREATSVSDAVERSDQAGEFDEELFREEFLQSLASGGFRLVLVLDDAPSELVQLVGYLESISSGIVVDLITVSAYEVGNEQILVPQRVDPDYQPESHVTPTAASARRASKARREVDGSDAFEEAIERAPERDREDLRRLLEWARKLEERQLASLRTVFGKGREVLLVWARGEKAGLASIWNDGGASISLWRTVFVRLAWEHISAVEGVTGNPIGQGTSISDPSPELLEALSNAYEDAAGGSPDWNGRDFYVSFGEGSRREWEEARQFGFIAAGGGAWYSRSLQMLEPGHRVFTYISKRSGVGGYVGVGEVTGEPIMAKDFVVESSGNRVPYLGVTKAPDAGKDADDPDLAEWIVPVRWLESRERDKAVKDSDFFANQNSAVRLTHGYTLKRLSAEFGVNDAAVPK